MHYAHINLCLKRRQDLLTVFFTSICSFAWKDRDVLWVEIPIERSYPLKYEFLIV